jgi:predicted  nucleic acid-binding Zn-ribbon protein
MEMTERIAKLEVQVDAIKDDVSELKGDVKDLHSRITTGNREILDKIDSMESKMGSRMDDSAKAAKKQHDEIEKNLRVDIIKIIDRVDVLERWRWMIVGGAVALGYLISHLELFFNILK